MSYGVNRLPMRDNGSTTIFRALGNFRRQEALLLLGRGEKELSDLAEAIGKKEAQLDDEPYGSKFRKRAYVSLMQTHLPKLDEWGFVEYDQDRQIIKGSWKAYACRWLVRMAKVIQ